MSPENMNETVDALNIFGLIDDLDLLVIEFLREELPADILEKMMWLLAELVVAIRSGVLTQEAAELAVDRILDEYHNLLLINQ